MDKSAKVEAAPAIVAPAKVAKKGKRDAEVAIEKNVSSKKQKRDVEAEQAALKKNVEAKTQKKAKTQKNVFSKTRKKPIKKQAFSSSDDDSSESDDEPKNAEGKTNVPTKKVPVAAAKQADSSSDNSESDDSTSDEDSQTPATPRAEGASKDLVSPSAVSSRPRSYDVGEAVDVHVNVEFGTEEAAQKALELIKEHELSGGDVRLDWTRERGAFTPPIGKGQSIYVRGFDKSAGEDEIRRSLQEHFGSCGEITRCEIPRNFYTGKIKGYAIIDFIDSGACTKALELNMSELGGYTLIVREAYPRGWGWGGWIRYGKGLHLDNIPFSGFSAVASQGKKTIFDLEGD